jgi:uncharacterized protein
MVLLETAAIYVGLNILILLVLAMLVSVARRTHKISLGDAGNDRMQRAMRAHANAAEYVPAALVGLVVLALFDPATPVWLIHAGGGSLTLGRVLHGFGLHAGTLNFGRIAGAGLTWLAYLLIGGGVIYVALAGQF